MEKIKKASKTSRRVNPLSVKQTALFMLFAILLSLLSTINLPVKIMPNCFQPHSDKDAGYN